MARRWRDPNGFRADPADAAARPTRRQSAALLLVLVLIAGVIAVVSYIIRPERARSFDLVGGSIFLADQNAPVAVDLATGSPSLRLLDATGQVGLKPQESSKLAVIPLDPGGGTLLLNQSTGAFNMVDATGFVIKHHASELPLRPPADTTAVGLPAHDPGVPGLAYIEQTGGRRTYVYLVSQATVRADTAAPSAAINGPGSTEPGASASADGSLWTLTGRGRSRSITQLSLPKNSSPIGAALRQHSPGTVQGPAAVGSAAVGADAQPSVVGVASAKGIRVFSPDGTEHKLRYATPQHGVQQVLAATNQTGRLSFLLQEKSGWSLVSVGADGTQLQRPTPTPIVMRAGAHITNFPATADLAPPAASGGILYTLDRSTGRLWQIGPNAAATKVTGAPTYYPSVKGEQGGWGDTYVIARDERVFYDSPSHREALAVFTDGTRSPLVIQKSAAVNVSAVADPQSLSRSRNQPPPTTKKIHKSTPTPTPTPTPTSPPPWKVGASPPPQQKAGPPPISNSIDCQNTTQKPLIPQVSDVHPGSSSVGFSVAYPMTHQDCIPRNLQVSVALLSNNAPPPPVPVTIADQQAVMLTGLYPSSTYQITVTAALGANTSSKSFQIRTPPQGPNAPTNVTVTPNAKGDWVLNWKSCGSAAANCIPSSSWQIQPTFCAGQGLLGAPPPLTVPADPTTQNQPTAVYHGDTALLGRKLSFQIMGRGFNNLDGTLSAPTPCTASWSPPKPSTLNLTASTPPETAFGTTTTANATLNLGPDPISDVGGVGATVSFTLSGNGTTQTNGPIVLDGSQSTVSTTFDGVTPGVQYSATASLQPAHGGPPIALTAPPLSTRSAWPSYTINPTCAQALLSCNLQIGFAGISAANSHGESFSLTKASQVRCNNTAQPLTDTGFDPGTSSVTATLFQPDGFYGACQVTVQLVEDTSAGQPVYGGIPSPLQTENVDLGPPTHANVAQNDFDVKWDPQGSSSVQVMYTGTQDLADLTTNWSETVTAPGGAAQCGSAQGQPGSTPSGAVLIPVAPACVNRYGAAQAPWTVSVQFTNRSDGSQGGPLTNQLPGPPPGYQPCDPQGLGASWGATQADGVSVTLGPNAQISGCSQWSYALYDGTGTQICTAATDGITGPPPAHLDTTLCGTPPGAGWSVRVNWVDTAGQSQQQDLSLGPPPPS